MVYGAQCSSTVLPGSRFFYRLCFASGPPKPAPEPSPDPPKLPGTAGVLPGPSGKLVYTHTRSKKNTMKNSGHCSITIFFRIQVFPSLFFRLWAPQTGPGANAMQRICHGVHTVQIMVVIRVMTTDVSFCQDKGDDDRCIFLPRSQSQPHSSANLLSAVFLLPQIINRFP